MAFRITKQKLIAGGVISIVSVILLSGYLTTSDYKALCNSMEGNTTYMVIENITGQANLLMKIRDNECVRVKMDNDFTTVYSSDNKIIAQWDYIWRYFRTYGEDEWVTLNRKASQTSLVVKVGTNQVNISRPVTYYATGRSGTDGALTEKIIITGRPDKFIKSYLDYAPANSMSGRTHQPIMRFTKLTQEGYNVLGYIWLDNDTYLKWDTNETLYGYSEGDKFYLPFIAGKGALHYDPEITNLKDGEITAKKLFSNLTSSVQDLVTFDKSFTIKNILPIDMPVSYFGAEVTGIKGMDYKGSKIYVEKSKIRTEQRQTGSKCVNYTVEANKTKITRENCTPIYKEYNVTDKYYEEITDKDMIKPDEMKNIRITFFRRAKIGYQTADTSQNYDASKHNDEKIIKKFESPKISERDKTWWDADWLYKKQINITEISTARLLNVTANVSIDTASLVSSGKMLQSMADARVVDSTETNEVGFWIKDNTTNTATSELMIKVSSIDSGATNTYYLYYGNAAATPASNATEAFLVGDDYNGNQKSYPVYHNVTTSGGTISAFRINKSIAGSSGAVWFRKDSGDGTGGLWFYGNSRNAITKFYAESRIKSGKSSNTGFLIYYYSEDAYRSDGNYYDYSSVKSGFRHDGYGVNTGITGNGVLPAAGTGVSSTNWYRVDIWNDGTTSNTSMYNDSNNNMLVSQKKTENNPSNMTGWGPRSYTSQIDVYTDYAFLTNFTGSWATMPSYEVGIEQGAAPPAAGKNRTKVGVLQPSYSAQPGWTKIFNMTFNVSTNDSGVIDCALYHNSTLVGTNVTVSETAYHTINYIFTQRNYNKSQNMTIRCHTSHNSTNATKIIWKDTWGNESWRYRERFVVENSGANILSGYPVNISVNTKNLIDQGMLNANCSNMIFRLNNTKNNTKLNYWIYTNDTMLNGCGATNTQIYVNVTLAAHDNVTFFMYTGGINDAKRSNGELVFPMFDDFDTAGTAIDQNKWKIMSVGYANDAEDQWHRFIPAANNRSKPYNYTLGTKQYHGASKAMRLRTSMVGKEDGNQSALAIYNVTKPTYQAQAHATVMFESNTTDNGYDPFISFGTTSFAYDWDTDYTLEDYSKFGYEWGAYAVGGTFYIIKSVQSSSGTNITHQDSHREGEDQYNYTYSPKIRWTTLIRARIRINSGDVCGKDLWYRRNNTLSAVYYPSNITATQCDDYVNALDKYYVSLFVDENVWNANNSMLFIDNFFVQRYSENVSFISKTYEPLDAPMFISIIPIRYTFHEQNINTSYYANSLKSNHGLRLSQFRITNSTYTGSWNTLGAKQGEIITNFTSKLNASLRFGRYNLTYSVRDFNNYTSTNYTQELWIFPEPVVTYPSNSVWDRKNKGVIVHNVAFNQSNYTYYYNSTDSTSFLNRINKTRPTNKTYAWKWNISALEKDNYHMNITMTYYKNVSNIEVLSNFSIIHDIMNISPSSFSFNTTFNKITWNADGTVNATNVTTNSYNGTDTITTTTYNDTFAAWNGTRFVNCSSSGYDTTKVYVGDGNLMLNSSGSSGGFACVRTRDSFLEDSYITYKIGINSTYIKNGWSNDHYIFMYKNVSGDLRYIFIIPSDARNQTAKGTIFKHVLSRIDRDNITITTYINGTLRRNNYPGAPVSWLNSSDALSFGIAWVDDSDPIALNITDLYVTGTNNYSSTVGNYTAVNVTIGANSTHNPVHITARLNATASTGTYWYLTNKSWDYGDSANGVNLTSSDQFISHSNYNWNYSTKSDYYGQIGARTSVNLSWYNLDNNSVAYICASDLASCNSATVFQMVYRNGVQLNSYTVQAPGSGTHVLPGFKVNGQYNITIYQSQLPTRWKIFVNFNITNATKINAWQDWYFANASKQNNRNIIFDYDTCAECDN